MPGDRLRGASQVLIGVGRAQRRGPFHVEPLRHVARQRVVRRRLVRDEVERLAAAGQLRDDVGRIADQPDREPAPVRRGLADEAQRLVERIGRTVEVARREVRSSTS